MARPIREDYNGAWHHVMNRGRNRGRNRELIFLDDEDAVSFLDAIGETVVRFGVEVHGYSLMPNHYHLLMHTPLGNLSHAMKHLGAMYTQSFNRRHGRDGSLFRGRFKSQLITYETYLIYVLAYIHLNPVRAGLVTRLDGLQGWTSHRRYMGKQQDPEWLETSVFNAQFENSEEMKTLILNLHRKAEPWPKGVGLGDGWINWLASDVETETLNRETKKSGVPMETLIEAICQITNVKPSRLKESVRGPLGNPERRFAVWAFQTSTYLTHREVGTRLNMTVQHVARDVQRSRTGIPQFEGWKEMWIEKYPSKLSIV
ncbi:MAG: hypothetical protein GY762_09505 [Proteobacteria bacterium]|nr:hypothetical protein [Pseudomonadota bacterium]